MQQKKLTNPFLMVALSFISVMFFGGFLLMHPWATQAGVITHPVDALFTSASALFVTGLAVVETGSYWSGWGQLVILMLVQVGALGVVTIGGYAAYIFGKRLFYTDKQLLSDNLGAHNKGEVLMILKDVMFYIFLIEFFGSLLLSLAFFSHGFSWFEAIKFGVFHAVSAFANAGFDIFALGDSGRTFIQVNFAAEIIMLLIVIGGLGYPVWLDLLNKVRQPKKHKLNYYSKLIIGLNLVLIILGTIGFWLFEYNNRYQLVGGLTHFKESIFHSISARTAGFSAFDLSEMSKSSLIVMMSLMFIGGSPASTAGGIKVISAFILLLMMVGLTKGDLNLQFRKRSFDFEVVIRAMSTAIISLILIVSATVFMEFSDNPGFLDVLFESFSAMGTVGLSLGLTSKLSILSKFILVFLMFVGRVGLYVLLYGYIFSKRKKVVNKNYPKAKLCL
ncbi:MAG: hypothetical protein IT416_02795 [Candidatus Pacebacteria bacterium]|nr:hypothetical protein [Candidatus Paceibacterota bacterium]